MIEVRDYQLSEEANVLLTRLEDILRVFTMKAHASVTALSPQEAMEMLEICDEGVVNFERASDGCAPIQRAIVGAHYTLKALEEWRKRGALAQ